MTATPAGLGPGATAFLKPATGSPDEGKERGAGFARFLDAAATDRTRSETSGIDPSRRESQNGEALKAETPLAQKRRDATVATEGLADRKKPALGLPDGAELEDTAEGAAETGAQAGPHDARRAAPKDAPTLAAVLAAAATPQSGSFGQEAAATRRDRTPAVVPGAGVTEEDGAPGPSPLREGPSGAVREASSDVARALAPSPAPSPASSPATPPTRLGASDPLPADLTWGLQGPGGAVPDAKASDRLAGVAGLAPPVQSAPTGTSSPPPTPSTGPGSENPNRPVRRPDPAIGTLPPRSMPIPQPPSPQPVNDVVAAMAAREMAGLQKIEGTPRLAGPRAPAGTLPPGRDASGFATSGLAAPGIGAAVTADPGTVPDGTVPFDRLARAPLQDDPLRAVALAGADRHVVPSDAMLGQPRVAPADAKTAPTAMPVGPAVPATPPTDLAGLTAEAIALRDHEVDLADETEALRELVSHGAASAATQAAPALTATARADALPASPGPILRQIAAEAEAAFPGGIEIELDPPELGRLRMVLSPVEAGLAAHLGIERPETLELLRRHADLLQRALAEAGFPDAALSFDLGTGPGRQEGQAPDHAALPDPAIGAEDAAPSLVGLARQSGTHRATASTEREALDIRL